MTVRTASLRIAVVGAGIAGLAFAIAMRRRGADVHVFDRRDATGIASEGLFLTLAPNGMNALDGLGAKSQIISAGLVTEGLSFYNECGRQIGSIDYADHLPRFGAPTVTIRRGALAQTLLVIAESEGAVLRLGRGVDRIGHIGREVYLSAGGISESFDLLAGADGARSTVRGMLFPATLHPRSTGLIGTGGVVDVPSVAPTGGLIRMTFGRNAFFGYLKGDGGPVFWFSSFAANPDDDGDRGGRSVLDLVRSLHRGDPLDNYRIVSSMKSEVQRYRDVGMPALARWHADRVVLIGDAAHPIAPHSGQGASMALEDAIVLAACLEAEDEPASAFRRFEGLRRQRIASAVALGKHGGRPKRALGPVATKLRDLVLPLVLPFGQASQEKMFACRVDLDPLGKPSGR